MSEHRIPIGVPDVGAGDETIRFGQWLADDGEAVLEGDRLAEVLISGILFSVAAPADGRLIHGNFMPGTVLTVGMTLGVIDASAANSSGS